MHWLCVSGEGRQIQRTFCGGCVVVFNSLVTIMYGILIEKECLDALYDRVGVHLSHTVSCTHTTLNPLQSTSTAQGLLLYGQGGVRLAKQNHCYLTFNCEIVQGS